MSRIISRVYRVVAGVAAGYLFATVVHYDIGAVPVMDESAEAALMSLAVAVLVILPLIPLVRDEWPNGRYEGE